MRKPVIIGNWKMNLGIEEAKSIITELKNIQLDEKVEKGICVPYTDLYIVKNELQNTDINLGAQNMHYEDNGAYTGEISSSMLRELSCKYVIIGHSERREYFNESDETINKKIKKAISSSIIPILCVGETLEERENNIYKEKIDNQLKADLKDISETEIENIIIAYEPIWAIGTGKTASSDDANFMCGYIRKFIENKYGKDLSEKIRIQYGGSVKANNIKELMSKDNIDGGLIGGASLIASDFSKIINFNL